MTLKWFIWFEAKDFRETSAYTPTSYKTILFYTCTKTPITERSYKSIIVYFYIYAIFNFKYFTSQPLWFLYTDVARSIDGWFVCTSGCYSLEERKKAEWQQQLSNTDDTSNIAPRSNSKKNMSLHVLRIISYIYKCWRMPTEAKNYFLLLI